jgi:Fe-S oxidoreductase
MIKFKQPHIAASHSHSLVVTYPRVVHITCGNYPVVEDIHNFIMEIKKNINEKDSYASNVKGGMTEWKAFLQNPLFVKFITYVINQHQLSNPNTFQYFYDKNTIINAWGNELKKGDYVQLHDHACTHGLLYLTEGSPLILPELNIEIDPRPGDYYIFPPCIQHYVSPQEEENYRYTLVFNIQGEMNWEKNKAVYERGE